MRLTGDDLGRVAAVALLAVFLVLVVFLRALVAPLYLVAASVLALAASLGLTVYVFQDLLGYGELTFYVPFVASVLLVALGSDYNVFLAGRIWQEARTRPLREAVAVGGARAASAITVAGVVLALSFALLALVPRAPVPRARVHDELRAAHRRLPRAHAARPALIALVGPVGGWPGLRPPRLAAPSPPTGPAAPAPGEPAVPVARAKRPAPRSGRLVRAIVLLSVASGLRHLLPGRRRG